MSPGKVPAAELLALAEAAKSAPDATDRELYAARLIEQASEVVAAVRHFLGTDPASALRMTAALAPLWQDAGLVATGRELTEAAIAAAAGPPNGPLARSLLAAAELAFRQGDQAAAAAYSNRAMDVGRDAGDPAAAALAHVNLARIAFRKGDASRIEEHAARAMEIGGSDAGARRGGLHMLAWAAYTAGDLPRARQRFEESLELRRQQGDRLAIASEVANLADLAAEENDLVGAARGLREALELARELNSNYLIVNLLPSLAAVAAREGDDISCARLLGANESIASSSGLIPDPGNWQAVMGDAKARLGERFDPIWAEGAFLNRSAAIELGLAVARAVSEE
jgi:tetratricopeptide (TPR) repeat protein